MSSPPPPPATALAPTPAASKLTNLTSLKPAIPAYALKEFQSLAGFECIEMLHGQPTMAIGAMENYVEIIYHGEPRNLDNVSVGTKLATKLERFGALFETRA